jgi:hypothetical protein
MNIPDLWQSAAQNSRDAANLLIPDMKPEQVLPRIEKALEKSRTATAALEALQRQLVGVPEPRRGE